MRTVRLADAPRSLAAYIEGLDEEVVLVTSGNRPVAALVPLAVEDSYESRLMKDPAFLTILARSRAQIAAGRSVTADEAFPVPPKRRPLPPSNLRRV